jgi:nucleotide-binding universal stress UspA family protein
MYRKILVGYTGDERGHEALSLARVLAEPTGAALLVATAVTAQGHPWEAEVIRNRRREAKLNIERAVAALAPELAVSVRALAGPSTAGTLCKLAEDDHADLLVLGSTRRGWAGRVLIGTTASQLLNNAPCPIVVAPHGYSPPETGLRTIAVAFDGSPQSEEALRWATRTATASGAALALVDVVADNSHERPTTDIGRPEKDVERLLAGLCAEAQARVDEALLQVPDDLALPGRVLLGDPAAQLCHEAKHGVDLLVAGSRGRSPLKRMLLGSVSSELMRTSPCPFVVVPSATTQLAQPGSLATAADSPEREL